MALPQTKEQIDAMVRAIKSADITALVQRPSFLLRRDRSWWYWHHRAERLRRQGKPNTFSFRHTYGSRKRRRLSATHQ